MSIHALEGRPAVFATGLGRSGTTAMRSALASHPGIISTSSENNIVSDLLHACDVNATLYSRRVSMQMSEKMYNARFATMILDLLFPTVQHVDDSIRPLFASHLSPSRAERALQLFPGSRFVCMIREGVATIESRIAHHTLGKQSFEEHCERWASWGVFSEWAAPRHDCLIVRHEQLLEDPVGSIAGVLAFLDLPDHPAPAEVLTGKRFHPTPDTTRPRWQTWTEGDRAIFERICGPAMRSLGYAIPWDRQHPPGRQPHHPAA
ncbi:MAG: sulfotransferase [Planctomycetota bacterium]